MDALVVRGKGLLACDESPSSLQKRFDDLGVENTEINRRNYRQMLFSADKVVICLKYKYNSVIVIKSKKKFEYLSKDYI